MPAVLARHPGARVLVAGPGDVDEARERMDPEVAAPREFLGLVSDEDKAALLSSVDVYVAPHTGGESFGIVLVEAMAPGTPVLASDLEAFGRVLDEGAPGRCSGSGTPAGRPSAVWGCSPTRPGRARADAAGQRAATGTTGPGRRPVHGGVRDGPGRGRRCGRGFAVGGVRAARWRRG